MKNQKSDILNVEALKALLSFIKIEQERHFFEEVVHFLTVKYGWKDFCFVSTHSMDESRVEKMRVLAGKQFSTDDFWKKIKDEKREDCFHFLGNRKNQYYFIVCSDHKNHSNDVELLTTLVHTFFENLAKIEDLKKSHDLIYIDDVTGLYNQRKLNMDLIYYVDHFQKHKHAFCVLFIDVDFFKKINDSHGHLVGTRILEMMAKEIKLLLRDTDLLYRYGGDEFVVLLPDTQLDGGRIVGQRILERIRDHYFEVSTPQKHLSLNMTLSIGVAECPTDADNVEDLLSFADRMMYGAKSSGRGTVFFAHDQLSKHPKKIS